MRTRAFTTDGKNRFLVLEVATLDDMKNVPRFLSDDVEMGPDGNYVIGTLSGGETVHLRDYIVYLGATPQARVEIEGVMYKQKFKVFDRNTFRSIFREARVVR